MHNRRPQIQNRKHAYRNTLVPQVSAQNVTKLDPKCTSDGRHVNADLCLEDPFGNEAEVSRIGVVALLLRLPLLLELLLQCDICNHP